GGEPQAAAQQDIDRRRQKLSVAGQRERLHAESRKRRVSAQNSHEDPQTVLVADQHRAVEKSPEKPDHQAPAEVDDQGPPGKQAPRPALNVPLHEVSQHRTQGAAKGYVQAFVHHGSASAWKDTGGLRIRPTRCAVSRCLCTTALSRRSVTLSSICSTP